MKRSQEEKSQNELGLRDSDARLLEHFGRECEIEGREEGTKFPKENSEKTYGETHSGETREKIAKQIRTSGLRCARRNVWLSSGYAFRVWAPNVLRERPIRARRVFLMIPNIFGSRQDWSVQVWGFNSSIYGRFRFFRGEFQIPALTGHLERSRGK